MFKVQFAKGSQDKSGWISESAGWVIVKNNIRIDNIVYRLRAHALLECKKLNLNQS